MTRKEFVKAFREMRERAWGFDRSKPMGGVDAATLMSLADTDHEALLMWRRRRKTLSTMSVSTLLDDSPLAEETRALREKLRGAK